MPDESLTRRRLLGGSLMLAGVPLCCTTPEVAPAAFRFEGGTFILDLARVPELLVAGTARAVIDPGRKLNLLVAHVERNRFVALDRSCTHNGAQCTYNRKRRTLQCTSLNHAEYDLAGRLLHGRTHGDLHTYPVRLAGSRLEIAVG